MSPVLVIEVAKGVVVHGCRGKLEQMYASLVPGKKNAACIICESFYVYYRFPLFTTVSLYCLRLGTLPQRGRLVSAIKPTQAALGRL